MKVKYKVSIPWDANPKYVKVATIIDSQHRLYPTLSKFTLKTGYYEVLVGRIWEVVVVVDSVAWHINKPALSSREWIYDYAFRYFKSQKEFEIFEIIRNNAHKYGIKIPSQTLALYKSEIAYRRRLYYKLSRLRVIKKA